MMGAEEKKWSTPRLRVFMRSRAEERVLGGCKAHPTVGPVVGYYECQSTFPVCAWCAAPTTS